MFFWNKVTVKPKAFCPIIITQLYQTHICDLNCRLFCLSDPDYILFKKDVKAASISSHAQPTVDYSVVPPHTFGDRIRLYIGSQKVWNVEVEAFRFKNRRKSHFQPLSAQYIKALRSILPMGMVIYTQPSLYNTLMYNNSLLHVIQG